MVHGKVVKIVTNHHALCWLKTINDPTGKLARWALKLAEFDDEIVHKSGKKQSDADCLSRNPIEGPVGPDDSDLNEVPTFLALPEDLASEQKKDPDCSH